MKKSRILSKPLNDAIAAMGHGDFIIISDAGFPIPEGKRVDLAIEADKPSITEILDLVVSDFIYERVIVAEEQKENNPNLYNAIEKLCDRCNVETIPHAQLIEQYPEKAKFIVRTGAFEPWGNVILCSGVDAPVWFKKPGTKVPDYYEERASYEET
ncbi:D-ribose pyranase [Sediminispirochaeta smaragdinae]|jgi:D-ribose pyranose/furanose isomerase RbsD|uniref:D-ribose pyranase n=1 Tax=Sediminispirochaeta smaragdinae (strain DSM 11293 / JCM 15392 / SEBR 4228) TaxID=573413 RepID=E1R2M1_SEDSS|nr:D-ribose pyranase [Sediminispirochaeta smaragdinae]ADK80303.1 RbsD or FucU transport [Sediminispirochaeta smaragdinae DSM 11293]